MSSGLKWSTFGASVRGPSHVISAQPNQDSWLGFETVSGLGVVVSDGLGSKPFADIGSEAACLAVKRAVQDVSVLRAAGQSPQFQQRVHEKWIELVRPFNPQECSATCLYAFVTSEGVINVGSLGDGCIGVLKESEEVVVLAVDKSDSFANVTQCLGTNPAVDAWRTLKFHESECRAVILCTDGVSADLNDIAGFVRNFVLSLSPLASHSASRHIAEVLEQWPVMGHSDDKTIACLHRTLLHD